MLHAHTYMIYAHVYLRYVCIVVYKKLSSKLEWCDGYEDKLFEFLL